MSSMNDFFNMMMQMGRRTPMYQNGGDLKMQSGSPLMEGWADGRKIRNNYTAENDARKRQAMEQEREDMFYKNLPYGQNQQGAVPQGIGANENGVWGITPQQPQMTEGKSIGFGDRTGSRQPRHDPANR